LSVKNILLYLCFKLREPRIEDQQHETKIDETIKIFNMGNSRDMVSFDISTCTDGSTTANGHVANNSHSCQMLLRAR
jgi:hypothetical protein